MNTALVLFVLTYALLLIFPRFRAYVAVASASAFVMLGILPTNKVFTAVDWNVIMMIAGTMGLVHLFIKSKMPSFLADLIIRRMPSVRWAIISLALFAGIVSAFIDNVATILIIAPVALTISKNLEYPLFPALLQSQFHLIYRALRL